MKHSILCSFLVVLCVNFTHSQISDADKKKIQKIVGEDFIQLKAKPNYPFALHPETCIVDTSTTLVGDTTGLIFNKEYVLFRDFIHFKKEKEIFSLINPNAVTIGEYQAFKDYVRDSIARLKLYHGIDEDKESLSYIKAEKNRLNEYGDLIKLNTSDRAIYLEYFPLNKDKRFSYDDRKLIPILHTMYLPYPQRFRRMREFDERKFNYKYHEVLPVAKKISAFKSKGAYYRYLFDEKSIAHFNLSILNDNSRWAIDALHNDDELGILSQLYGKMSDTNPVIGLLGTQAKAFCNWKQNELQRDFDENSIPYHVIVTLPSPDQLKNVSPITSFRIPARNFSDQWRITKAEYLEFEAYVRDSVARDVIYEKLKEDKEAEKFINYEDFYFGEGMLEYVDYDASDRPINRELWTLNFKTKIKQSHLEDPLVQKVFKETDSFDKLMYYRYETVWTKAKATEPAYEIGESGQYNGVNVIVPHDSARWFDLLPTRKTIENRDAKNEFGFGSGVRLLHNLGNYIEVKNTFVLLDDKALTGDPNSLISRLSYEQALAYYNWKFPIDKFNPEKENWQDFVYPSEEQFNAIQRGETIVIPAHEVDFPTPLFRYVVHVYHKD